MKNNEEFFGKVIGAHASILIDYKDYYGVMEMAKYYVKENGWKIINIDKEYFTFENKQELPKDYRKYFDEIIEYGYSMIFNTYDKIE